MSRPPRLPEGPLSDPTLIADRLHSAAIHLLRRLRKQDEKSGLSAARVSALSVLVFGGPLTIGQLAQAEQVKAPTMTRLVMGMQRDGLLTREPDAHDRRVVWIRATPKGGRILREARRRRVLTLARLLEALEETELLAIARAAGIMERLSASASGPRSQS